MSDKPTPSWMQRGYDTDIANGLNIEGKDAAWAKERKGQRTDVECPVCEANMRIQTRKKDGNPFLGCSAFPNCKKVISAWGPFGRHIPKGDITKEREEGQDFYDDAYMGWGEDDGDAFTDMMGTYREMFPHEGKR